MILCSYQGCSTVGLNTLTAHAKQGNSSGSHKHPLIGSKFSKIAHVRFHKGLGLISSWVRKKSCFLTYVQHNVFRDFYLSWMVSLQVIIKQRCTSPPRPIITLLLLVCFLTPTKDRIIHFVLAAKFHFKCESFKWPKPSGHLHATRCLS